MKAHHALVTGDSGGGKSTLAKELAAAPAWVTIWINWDADDTVPTGRQRSDVATVRSGSGLLEAVRAGASYVNFRTDNAQDAIGAARSVGYHELNRPLQIIVDEAHEVMPTGADGAENGLAAGLRKDRDKAIRFVVVTQDPSDLAYSPLKQIRYWSWVGPWSGFHDGFLNAHGWIPRDELPEEDYQYVVMNKRGGVLYRGETKQKYT